MKITTCTRETWKVKVKLLSQVRLFATPRTVACQALPSMGFSRQEYWSGLPFPPFYTWNLLHIKYASVYINKNKSIKSIIATSVLGKIEVRDLKNTKIRNTEAFHHRTQCKEAFRWSKAEEGRHSCYHGSQCFPIIHEMLMAESNFLSPFSPVQILS